MHINDLFANNSCVHFLPFKNVYYWSYEQIMHIFFTFIKMYIIDLIDHSCVNSSDYSRFVFVDELLHWDASQDLFILTAEVFSLNPWSEGRTDLVSCSWRRCRAPGRWRWWAAPPTSWSQTSPRSTARLRLTTPTCCSKRNSDATLFRRRPVSYSRGCLRRSVSAITCLGSSPATRGRLRNWSRRRRPRRSWKWWERWCLTPLKHQHTGF